MRRTLDIVLALLLLLILSPMMAVAAAAIVLETGRPIVFSQIRAGRQGSPFRIYKLRTLRSGPKDEHVPSAYTTQVGRILRRYAIDELPQLWNVVRGDMSLVGPRPILMPEARGYDGRQRRRLEVRPGLTGWAQIHGRNALTWHERVALDLWYVENRSLSLDLRVLLRTPWVLFSGLGVYGPGTQDPDTVAVMETSSSATPDSRTSRSQPQ